MARSQSLSRPLLALVATLALALPVVGCATEVIKGGGNGGDGGDGGGGEDAGEGGEDAGEGGAGGGGGEESCAAYTGAGCTPGDSYQCDPDDPVLSGLWSGCELVPGEKCATQWDEGCNTPLVLSFDGGAVEYLADREHGFDVNGSRSQVTDWPTAKTPWLAIDRNGNGRIDDGGELFGSMSVLGSGGRAENGFVALRELDGNGDGRITAEDPGFSRLLVWSDQDGDRLSGGAELTSASGRELLALDLGYTVERHCDSRGNCEVERASFRYRDGVGIERTGAVIDIHLAVQR